MPIVVSRETGRVISMPAYTQEQIDQAWVLMVRYILDHDTREAEERGTGQ